MFAIKGFAPNHCYDSFLGPQNSTTSVVMPQYNSPLPLIPLLFVSAALLPVWGLHAKY